MASGHTFHIPVMGIGFTADTPLKTAQYGIDSVISLVDDELLESLRKMYCSLLKTQYNEITSKNEDCRAVRITEYLNLIADMAQQKFSGLKDLSNGISHELIKLMNMLPEGSRIRHEFNQHFSTGTGLEELKVWLDDNLSMGSIDVNIMTKVDKENFWNGEKLPVEYNDAHSALRGYANSKLNSSLILSAGMNPRLYSYIEKFEDFFPDTNGEIRKKIVLKVSDFRSASIQGKFLAKKGVWVSEYRIESGLNCGGHAFATDGYLMGPIMAEFRDQREELARSQHEIFIKALSGMGRSVPSMPLKIKITAQGGVGTAGEHRFLLEHYLLDSVGWGTPFLLVPEVTNIDEDTLQKLAAAREDDLYLSGISPLGVPFNNLRGNTKDEEKKLLIKKGKPGSACPKRYVALNKEYSEKGTCTASRQFQYMKIKELNNENLLPDQYKKRYDKIVEKSCICVGLGTSALLVNNIDTQTEGTGVSICPGPNLAYFSKVSTLEEMAGHIYGRNNVITRTDRPHMFVKEIEIYVDYLKNRIDEVKEGDSLLQEKYLFTFAGNLKEGIKYYNELFKHDGEILKDLSSLKKTICHLESSMVREGALVKV